MDGGTTLVVARAVTGHYNPPGANPARTLAG